jgi:hypothetical protein
LINARQPSVEEEKKTDVALAEIAVSVVDAEADGPEGSHRRWQI